MSSNMMGQIVAFIILNSSSPTDTLTLTTLAPFPFPALSSIPLFILSSLPLFYQVSVINFNMTSKALEDQFLLGVVHCERPDLEDRRLFLMKAVEEDQRHLFAAEEHTLTLLAGAAGSLLGSHTPHCAVYNSMSTLHCSTFRYVNSWLRDNTVYGSGLIPITPSSLPPSLPLSSRPLSLSDNPELITALERSATSSLSLRGRLSESHMSTLEITAIREGYRPIAASAGVLFSAVFTLSHINPMYQYPLSFFEDILKETLGSAGKTEGFTDRLTPLLFELTQNVYSRVCRGLFERDRLLLAVLISARLDVAAGRVTESEWQCFLTGCVTDPTVCTDHPMPDALKALGVEGNIWDLSVMLESLQPVPFMGLTADVRGLNCKDWATFFSSHTPHTDVLPGVWEDQLSHFHRLLLVRILKEGSTMPSMGRYVGETILEVCCVGKRRVARSLVIEHMVS
jgi:ATP-binding dynein motor region